LLRINMSFLVTGGAGRLGREIIELITSLGYPARAFDLSSATWDAIPDISGVQLVKGDVTDRKNIFEACRRVDVVIHLAALLPPNSEADREFTMKVNLKGTRNIVKALDRQNDVPLIFASSISTYGITANEDPPIGEDHIQNMHNNYSESKIEAERLIRASEIPHVILRIAPIAVTDLVVLPDTIPYRADQRVEFIHVVDAARALFEAAINPGALGKTLNIAGGPSWQMTGAEYIKRSYSALGVEVDPVFSEDYTALDWYDTSKSRFLGYQMTTFNGFLERLRVLGEEMGLR
jgi:nucleoside-diphosphate-sugar epimerase